MGWAPVLGGDGFYKVNEQLLTGYVPYTGATADVNLGTHSFTTTGKISTGLFLSTLPNNTASAFVVKRSGDASGAEAIRVDTPLSAATPHTVYIGGTGGTTVIGGTLYCDGTQIRTQGNSLTFGSLGPTSTLTYNFQTVANTVGVSSATGITKIDWGSLNLITTGTLGAGAITGTSLTDGTATLDDGSLTGAVNGTFSGTVQAEQLTSTDDADVADKLTVNHIGEHTASHNVVFDNIVRADSGLGIGIVPTSSYLINVLSTATLLQMGYYCSNASGRTLAEFGMTTAAGGAFFDMRAMGSSYSETLFGTSMADAVALIAQLDANFVIGNYANAPLILGTNNLARLTIAANGAIDAGANAISTTGNLTGIIKYNFTIPITNPTNADDFKAVATIPRAATITSVKVLALGGGTLTCIINETDANGVNPAQIINSITATSTTQSATITNSGITAGNTISYVSTGLTGTVIGLRIIVEYTMSSQ